MNKVDILLPTIDRDALNDYYQCHTSQQVIDKFNLQSYYILNKIVKRLNIKKYSFDDFLKDVEKDEFIEYYFSHSKIDTLAHFNISDSIFDKYMKYYDIHKPQQAIKQVRENTNLERYGCENQFQRVDYLQDKIKDKYGSLDKFYCKVQQIINHKAQLAGVKSFGNTEQSKSKRRQTCKQKYGVEYVTQTQEFKDKSKQTKLNRYGDAGYHNIDKMKQTNLQKYGVEYNFASTDGSINGRGTCLKKYGHENYNNRQKAIQTIKEKYGEDYFINQVKLMMKSIGSRSNSKLNNSFYQLLVYNQIKCEREFVVGNYVYDFKIDNYLIELDPFSTHNSTWGIFDNPKDKFYHRNKTLNAVQNGYVCIHIYDWVDSELILWLIMEGGVLGIVDTGVVNAHIYDHKKKELTNKESEDTVVIYDDGFNLVYSLGENNGKEN